MDVFYEESALAQNAKKGSIFCTIIQICSIVRRADNTFYVRIRFKTLKGRTVDIPDLNDIFRPESGKQFSFGRIKYSRNTQFPRNEAIVVADVKPLFEHTE